MGKKKKKKRATDYADMLAAGLARHSAYGTLECVLRLNDKGEVDDAGRQEIRFSLPQARRPSANKPESKN